MPAIDLNSALDLETDLPIALFPIRLETRFIDNNLLVRIYPDTIHVNSFEPKLTEAEVIAGKKFWIYTWLAGNNTAQKRSAWAQLAQHFGATRAAWIAKKLEPLNPSDQPEEPISVKDNKLDPEIYLPVIPKFPEPTTHQNAWTRAPFTEIMPSKWIALIYEKDDSEPFVYDQGERVKSPLSVGISPQSDIDFDVDTLEKDEEIGWLFNFEKARNLGMGLRIPYPSDKPIKRLLVLGVKTGKQEAAELQKLIDAHHYTQGISFLAQGTLTNNIDSDVPSGYSTFDPGFENSYLIERDPSPAVTAKTFKIDNDVFNDLLRTNTNRVVTAKAFGVDDGVFSHVREANVLEQLDAQMMNATLWHATWGYFLEQMMAGPNALSEKELSLARSHFERYVRARGPFPAIRVGKQPYGVLPVISLKHWKSVAEDTSIDNSLVAFLFKLREIWEKALECVPKVPGGSGTFDELQAILNLSPISVSYQQRPGQRIALHPSSEKYDTSNSGNQTTKDRANNFGLSWTPRHIRMVYGNDSSTSQWSGELIESAEDHGTRVGDYFDYLNSKKYDEIQLLKLNAETDPLFFWLLRESCLREYLAAAFRVLKALKEPHEESLEKEYEEAEISTLWEVIMHRSVSKLNPPKISDYLDSIKQQLPSHNFDIAKLGGISVEIVNELVDFAAFFRNLHYLKYRSNEQLDKLFRETLDLCSHRYDAWVTSMASKRLETIRNQPHKSKGIYFGGYGWVDDFKRKTVPEMHHGFIHAPSLAQATTAAILRSGYLSRTDPKDREALAINLSSERVRTALRLLDGVRQGQSLAALLGYLFERGLHENHPDLILDKYISIFRKVAPLDIKAYTEEILNAQPTNQVVDGFALLQRWQSNLNAPGSNSHKPIPWGEYGLPAVQDTEQYNACVEELKRLEDAVDAIADLVIAESVHQIAQGNPVRAGATMTAIAEGEAPPPELDVIRTPRSGIAITHRIAIIFSNLPKEMVWGPKTARALAEPYLNAWVAQLLGSRAPKAICQVEFFNAEKLIPSKPLTITLDQLGLAPIDLLYLPESEGDAQRSELELRVIYLAQQSLPANQISISEIRLNFAPSFDSANTNLSFAEVLEIARVIRKLITSSRELNPGDLTQPGQAIPREAEEDKPQPGESADSPLALGERTKLLKQNFKAAYTKLFIGFQENKTVVISFDKVRNRLEQLSTMISALSEDSLEQLIDCQIIRENLMQLSLYGLADAIPIEAIGNSPEIQKRLLSQLQSILDVIKKRCNRLDTLADDLREFHVATMHEIFGKEFRVLPRFSTVNSTDLHKTFLASNKLQRGNPLESVTWFQRIARVREGAARLDSSLMYTEAIGGSKLGFTIGQLPYKDGEQWVALDGDLPGSRLSLAIQAPAGLDFSNPVSGLLIDEWVEVIPSKEEITGLTFHFDSPQSRAPQAILLAVPPNNEPKWSLAMLADTVLETMVLAKLRSVDLARLIHPKQENLSSDVSYKIDPSTLTEIGQFLPALYFPPARAPE